MAHERNPELYTRLGIIFPRVLSRRLPSGIQPDSSHDQSRAVRALCVQHWKRALVPASHLHFLTFSIQDPGAGDRPLSQANWNPAELTRVRVLHPDKVILQNIPLIPLRPLSIPQQSTLYSFGFSFRFAAARSSIVRVSVAASAR